ncbi:MAG TPA: glycosyltransferase family 4 protein [Gaiellaceae bacterium]|nr:glycosyltransferase family 4 protein [Gaiellaceae bacterium]
MHVHRMRGIGGSERHLLTLLPALRSLGLDASFAGLDDLDGWNPQPFYDELEQSGVPFARTTSGRRLRSAFRGADVVHTHLVHADLLGALLAGGGTLVSTKHNDDPFRARLPFRFVERALTRRAARVICITDSLRRFNIERVGLPPGKLEVVHYGMDAPPAAWAPNELELPEGKIVAAVARLEPQKGLDLAVAAMADIDATLVVLGVGPEQERLEALARAQSIRLLLPGRVGDVAAVLRRADVLVHPARWEGFGLALLEAMLCSLPVVATRVSSIPEIVADGETGILVPPDDVPALAAALRRVLADPGGMGAAGLERARSEFSVAKMAGRTLAVYVASSEAL